MKILVLASTFPRWANDTVPPFIFLLNKSLQERGFEMVTVAPHHPGARFSEIMDGMKIYRFPYFFPFSLERLCYEGGIMANFRKSVLAKFQVPFFLLMELSYALYVFLKESPRIIHAHWIIPQGFISSIVSGLTGTPLILSVHGSDVFIFRRGLMRHLIVFATKSANMVTLNSSASLGALTGIDRKSKKMIIPLGIDVAKFSPENQDPDLKVKLNIGGPFLLSVGRLVELKGLTYLIAAMKKIVADAPTAKLVVIGTGPEAEKLKKQSKELGIAQQVIFLGGIQNSELPKYYASADIFIGPSVKTDDGATESFGIVFLEALASGTAVISTDSGGIGDIVKDGVTGIVVPERNSECIYEAVQKIIAEPDFRARLRRNGLQMTRDLYSWNKVGKMFGDLYMNVHKNP